MKKSFIYFFLKEKVPKRILQRLRRSRLASFTSILRHTLIIFVVALLLAPSVLAAGDLEIAGAQAEALETGKLEDALSGEAGELLGDISVMDSLDAGGVWSRLFSGVLEKLSGIIKSGLKDAALIVLVAVLCSVVTASFGAGGTDYVILAGVLAIAAVSVTSVNSFIGLGRTTLDELSTFSKMLMPTLTTAAASAGALTSAAAKYAATTLFMDVMITLSKNLIMPLILAYLAVSIAEAAAGGDGLSGAAGLIKWMARTILLIIVIAFVAYLSITGVISGSNDAVAVRATKTAISTVLPVVGSIIADASDTVLSGASILRNAVGVFGLLAVFAICIIPFLRLGASYLLFKAAGGLADSIADKRIGKLINAVSSAFGLTLGMTGAVALMLYISIISVIKAVV